MKKQAHILLLRFSALGDVAILVPLLRVFYKSYPQVQLTLVTKAQAKPLFKEFDKLRIFPIDTNKEHKGFKGIRKRYKTLREEKFTAIADLHGVLRSYLLSFFFFTNGFFKIASIDKNRSGRKKLTRPKGKTMEPLTPTIYNYARVFKKLGFPLDMTTHTFPKKPLLGKTLLQKIPAKKSKWVGIAPFAAHLGKMYPLHLMQEVIASLQLQYQVFLFGAGKQENEQLQIWEEGYPKAFNTADKLSFEEQLNLIANLDAMLSMDSANGHLAANYEVPVVTLWGMTHPFLGFQPFGQPEANQLMVNRKQYPQVPTSVYGKKIPKGYEKAFYSISPQQVVERVFEVLQA